MENVSPRKIKRVKGNTQNWVDGEIIEKPRLTDKLFKAFKETRLHIKFDKD